MYKRFAMGRYLLPLFPQNLCKQYTETWKAGGQYETDQNIGTPYKISEKQIVTIRARFAIRHAKGRASVYDVATQSDGLSPLS
jgi:hypothetical protein